ncbi:WxL domain-containing protein [Enterococcus hirae]
MLGTGVSAATTTANTTPAPAAQTTTPVISNFTVSSTDTNNPTPPSPTTPTTPGTPSSPNPGNVPLNPNGTFGLAYLPAQFNFGSTELTGKTTVSATAQPQTGKTFNVGVKDTTHTNKGWTLNASLQGELTNYGAHIKITNTEAKLNNGGNLTSLPNSSMISVNNNIDINSASSNIMTGNANGTVFSGTYDLKLGNVSLEIPNASVVPAGDASGTVNWDLQQTPTNP